MERRTVLKALGGATITGGLAGCTSVKAYVCGDVPDFENTDGGRRVEISGVAGTVDEDGSYLFVEDHDSKVLVNVAPSSHRHVEMNVDSGDCVRVKGTVSYASGSDNIKGASVE